MNMLKKHSVAVIISAVVCVVTLLVGVHLSIGRQTAKIEESFVTGVFSKEDNYTHPGIAQQLDDRATAVLGIVSVVSDYDELSDEADALRLAREQLMNTKDGAIYDKYVANNAIQDAYDALLDALGSVTLDERDQTAMDSYTQTMGGTQQLIENSWYNNSVSEFERSILGSFPINILKYASFADTPEYFGAEG